MDNLQLRQLDALRFHLRAVAGIDTLLGRQHYAGVDVEAVDMVLDQAARYAAEELAPLGRRGDAEGCSLEHGSVRTPSGTPDAYARWCDSGFGLIDLPEQDGGLGFPRVVQIAVQELCDAANLAFGMFTVNVHAAALVLLAQRGPRLPDFWVDKVVSGEWGATIAISEPQAGSDVGRIATRAEPAADGSWRLTGSKCWISYGDQDLTEQIAHIVLARVPDGEPGSRGLGLFLVGKRRVDEAGTPGELNNVTVQRLEEKMGMHGSPTCVLALEDSVGILLGEPGRGLAAMFVMMNVMRLAVAVQGSAVAAAATLTALEYALQRGQGGRSDDAPRRIAEHADVQRMLLESVARSELIRALNFKLGRYQDDALSLEDAAARAHCQALADFLLPVAKTTSAEHAFDIASTAMQVHGGYGYTRDYLPEQLARDVRVTAIYEGTSGIQALDLVGRKLRSENGANIDRLLGDIEASLAGAAADNPVRGQLEDLAARFAALSRELLAGLPDKRRDAEAGAYAYLRFTGLLAWAWCALDLCEGLRGDSPYERLLAAALEAYQVNLEAEAGKWERLALRGGAALDVDPALFSA